MSIFSKLAEGMEIHYDTVVKRVEVVRGVEVLAGRKVEMVKGRGVRVVDSRGNVFTGDKVKEIDQRRPSLPTKL